MTIETKPTWAACCEKDGLIAHSTNFEVVFAAMARHQENCNKKIWSETYRQYLDRLKEQRLKIERKLKQEEAFKSSDLRVEG